MANRDGTATIIHCLFELTRIVGVKGIPSRLADAFPSIAVPLLEIISIVNVAKGLDDSPTVIDREGPFGPEDTTP
jgi:hypothetical protein